MSLALVIGKFYPFHAGHRGLIEHAAASADRVAVLAMGSREESIPLQVRVGWIAETFAGRPEVVALGVRDDAPVDYASDVAWAAHVALMSAALAEAGLPHPDVVVTSEPYGAELAERLGARHVGYDPGRTRDRVSGTTVRDDLAAAWPALPEPVRRTLATRVIVLGAESTGSTTLAGDLFAHFSRRPGFAGMRRVEEYGRAFTVELFERAAAEAAAAGRPAPALEELVWTTEHFAHIAARQTELEEEAALAHPLVVADTDAFATSLWERRYVGEHSHGARRAATELLPRRDLYLLTDHVGVPFEQDGWRDGEHIRERMHGWFVRALTAAGHSWLLLRGDREERLRFAVDAVEAAWRSNTAFASPAWAERTTVA